jgi:hypothetical protein
MWYGLFSCCDYEGMGGMADGAMLSRVSHLFFIPEKWRSMMGNGEMWESIREGASAPQKITGTGLLPTKRNF